MSAPDFEDEGDDNEGETHYVPINDTRQHEASCDCWCGPHQDEDDETLYVHNSENDLADDRTLH